MKLAFAALALSAVLPAAAVETYVVDPRHTFPMYEADHYGFSFQRGRFNKTSGRITLDAEAHRGSAEIAIDTRSVSTGVEKLDERLQGDEFFDSAKHPQMTFKSEDFRFEGDNLVAASGDLTIAGITHPVTFKVNHFHCGLQPLGKRKACGADLEARIKRSDFNMRYGLPGLGDTVLLRVNVEAVAQ